MSTAKPIAPAPAPPIVIEPRKEVRFAVVMYGGVSLAIYINGVAQELFRLVRSTAAAGKSGDQRTALSGAQGASPDNSLSGTERVYRKVSHLLSDEELLIRLRKQADEVGDDKAKAEALALELEKLATDDSRVIGTTFVVDILSGTSAGGINSIYLAKALANEQRIDRLKQLWITEGDIELLLNDSGSLQGIDLDAQDPPVSLLNSRRMYLKLLRALDDMDRDHPRAEKAPSPYSKELDLYITATDIEGVPVPLKLADKIVFERRHRNVFHFEYQEAEKINDFVAESNPFLAFAARCTSSFPFAFEPMRLIDIDEVLNTMSNYCDNGDCKSDSPKWRRYFREILDPQKGVPNLNFARRSFGDGGYLDNKPFSYAIEALVRRQSDVPVDRRLIYVEPSPEHPEDVRARDYKPDALQNVKSALLDLPTYETIREDLQRVLQRNLLIDRVQRITSGVERDINEVLPKQFDKRLTEFKKSVEETGKIPALVDAQKPMWAQKNLTAMVDENGRSFLSYRKLRVSAVTNEIARLMARLLNFDADSDLLLSMRCLVRAWRESNYYEHKNPTLNQFLTDYDLGHRIRRLNFIRERIDRLYNFDWTVQQELAQFASKYDELYQKIQHLSEAELRSFRDVNADMGWLLGLLSCSKTLSDLNAKNRPELRNVLIFMKCEVNQVYKYMQMQARKLRQRRSQETDAKEKEKPGAQEKEKEASVNPLLDPFEAIGLRAEHLREIIDPKELQEVLKDRVNTDNTGAPNEDDCLLVAKKFLEHNVSTDINVAKKLNDAANELKKQLDAIIIKARERIGMLLDPKATLYAESTRGKKYLGSLDNQLKWTTTEAVAAVREYLAYYYYNFEEYDQISFPIFYEADVGEASIVEVIRVSPEDATELIDERKERRESPDGKGRQKLAGIAFHHFGAFLDRTWRQNDIMWGRLDGFERLVSALLPGSQNESLRKILIREGHTSILIDELPPESRLQLGGLVSEALLRASAGEPIDTAVARVTGELTSASPVRTRLESIIRGSLENQELLDFIKTGYEVNRNLDPKPLLTSISRSTQIIGKVFESVANENQYDGKSLRWIARLGQLFWGLVEVAVPNSIKNMLWDHWLSVVYAFEFFTILAGIVLSSQGAQRFGWTALGITAALNLIVLVLKDIMRGRQAVFRTTGAIVGLIILFLAALGLLEVLGPVFGVRWGDPQMYPMTWLKETIKAAIPFRNTIGPRVFNAGILVSIMALIVLLNSFFGLVDFSWLGLRWQLCQAWWKKSKLRSYLPWGHFKPISIIATDLQQRTKPLPGKQDLFMLPFSFSTLPPSDWLTHFEKAFDEQTRARASAISQHVMTNNKEVLVVSNAAELRNVFQTLNTSATIANEKHESAVLAKQESDYNQTKWLIRMKRSKELIMAAPVPDNISTELEAIGQQAAHNPRTIVARVIGVLTIAAGAVVLLLGLALPLFLLSKNPDASLPGGLHVPGMALQLAHTEAEANRAIEVQGILQGARDQRIEAGKSALSKNIRFDSFAVIPGYVLALGLLCIWLTTQSSGRRRIITGVAAVSVILAALFDYLENKRMRDFLDGSRTTVAGIASASSLKWIFLFLVVGLLGRKLWTIKSSLIKWIGLYLILTAAVGAIGVLVLRVAVEWGFWLMGIGLVLVGVSVIFFPNRFRET
ncbi:MAG TPA: patatin-like protein [Pyrinomonadaceae bacterium]|nr:patatin-like protein [Pyrinomonadaceae bacterium]